MLDKVKNWALWLLGILGIIYLFNLYRKLKDGSVDLDISEITDRIKDGEDKLRDIQKSDDSIEDIIDKWNK